jgi:hypothetical protein
VSVPVEPPEPPLPNPPINEPPRQGLNEIRLLELETYDGSGEVVHPDVTRTPDQWAARQGHLVITPYPNGNATVENPSIFLADNGFAWKVAPGVTNPIARPPQHGGHLSDPDQVYDPTTGELWLYYRQVTSQNEIYLMRSKDAIEWTTPVLVLSAPNHQIISPSVVRRWKDGWWMWSVNSGGGGCGGGATTVELRRSNDGITWTAPRTVRLPHGDISPWHINVEWISSRQEFWAVYNGKTPGSCTTPALYFAKSVDGLNWTVFPRPLLQRGAIPQFQDIVYRSTFQFDPYTDEVTFWYSGARYVDGKYQWRAAVQRLRRETVFALNQPLPTGGAGASLGMRQKRLPPHGTTSPPLTDRTAP